MKHKILSLSLFILSGLVIFCGVTSNLYPQKMTFTKDRLMDKIKGGWAGQTIGCTYGGPAEFKFLGQMIPDSVKIGWPDGDHVITFKWLNPQSGKDVQLNDIVVYTNEK